MKTLKALHVEPKSLFHVGEAGIGIERVTEFPHSDTIFSAICNCYALLKGKDELEALLKKFRGKPPFLISSALPLLCLPSGERILFFPKPKVPLRFRSYVVGKEFKVASYLSASLLGEKDIVSLAEDGGLVRFGEFMVRSDEFESIRSYEMEVERYRVWRGHVVGNVLDRLTSKSTLYYRGVTSYSSGIHFCVLFKGEVGRDVEASLRLLKDEGLGGERSLGYGIFNFEFCEVSVSEVDNSNLLMTLSLYHPTCEEFMEFRKTPRFLNYRLVKRSGYAYSPFFACNGLLRRWVRMLAEGSTFPRIEDKDMYGCLVEVLRGDGFIPHSVYRYGYAFTLGLNEGWLGEG